MRDDLGPWTLGRFCTEKLPKTILLGVSFIVRHAASTSSSRVACRGLVLVLLVLLVVVVGCGCGCCSCCSCCCGCGCGWLGRWSSPSFRFCCYLYPSVQFVHQYRDVQSSSLLHVYLASFTVVYPSRFCDGYHFSVLHPLLL